MLWEDEFYEDGQSIADRIRDLVMVCDPLYVHNLAVHARHYMNLRHVPLLLAAELFRRVNMGKVKMRTVDGAALLNQIVCRPDELAEFLAIYWREGKTPIAKQAKKGLADAFDKFNEYQLAKWDRDGLIKLRDVMRLVHPRPKNKEQDEMWGRLLRGELKTPDTWEVAISAARSKEERHAQWSRLLRERKLGGLALLRNLRNMQEDGVDRLVISDAIQDMNTDRILPFRFIAAAKYAKSATVMGALENKMLESMLGRHKMPGMTLILIDVSESMDDKLSSKSDLTRLDAACGVAVMLREITEGGYILTFSESIASVEPLQGFSLIEAIKSSQSHGGTRLGQALRQIAGMNVQVDRVIIITDEQSKDRLPAPNCRGYVVNVASAKNGVGYGEWLHIDGFSEAVVDYIVRVEECFQDEDQER